MFETLLLNILFLILPVLLFIIFFDTYKQLYNHIFLVIISTISMFLCMIYPIQLEIGFIFDLRYIPFIIVALYGGYKNLFLLYLVLNIYRFIIGGEGTLHSLIFSTFLFLVVPLLSKKFSNYNSEKRIITGVSVAIITMSIYLLILSTYFDELTSEYWELVFYAITTHVAVMVLIMLMIEKIILNMKTREKYLHTERLHVLSELSASVSHEIRNPLTVTNGFLQLLKESKNLSADEKMYIDYSLKELDRAKNIVSDFLAFAKPQSENMIYSNLQEEIEYVKNILMPFGKMNQVNIDYHFTNSLHLNYDKNQMKQCLLNLLKNGIEAMKEKGGTLYVNVNGQGQDQGNIIITIKDEGIGMTKDELSQLGKPYYSTKKEGTGLGMLMVYGTISKVNGHIHVESKKGLGTTFIITIPV